MVQSKAYLCFALSVVLCWSLNSTPGQAAGLEADWVLYNGKILTTDTEDPANFTIAEAVAIYDGKFVAVGSSQEVLEYAGPSTRQIDLAGKTVLPGLIETHLHVNSMTAGQLKNGGLSRTDLPIKWNTKEEGLAQLRTVALTKKPGEWIVVNG